MELEDQEERRDTEEEEEDEAEEEQMELPVGYDSLGNSSRVKMANSGGEQPAANTLVVAHQPTTTKPRYKECLKNHAVGLGGHAVDGCGEFMAAGAEGTLDALKCAACNCHRNFHRKVSLGSPSPGGGRELFFHGHPLPHPQPHHLQLQQFAPYYRPPTGYLHVAPQQQRPLALPSTSGGGGQSREDQEDMSNPSGGYGGVDSGGGGGSSSSKRFRTKFTQEQKERMLGLAERLGWKMQRNDEALVHQFCNETGVKRNVLKVWMHNNKHTLGKKP